MGMQCAITGKKPAGGNKIRRRGKAKYLGGVGTKVTGISRRKFKPNLQHIKVSTTNGTVKSMRVCTSCIRTGVIRKAVKARPFKLPASAANK